MAGTSTEANRRVRLILNRQVSVISRAQAIDAGLTQSALRHRLRPGGPWSVLLPGIYLVHGGNLTAAQREIAALLHAGDESVLTGPAALFRFGFRVPYADLVDVLIPFAAKRQSSGFVRVHRTTRVPDQPVVLNGVRWAPAARAVADTARVQPDRKLVRALVAEAVQQRHCTVSDLVAELRRGPGAGSGALRAALAEVADGVRSVAEGDLRRLVKRHRLPDPQYNVDLFGGNVFLARPDAWWAEAGVAVEVDSREWHLLPRDWERTMARHNLMSAHGIIVVHFTPRRIRSESAAVAAELRAAIDAGLRRPRLEIRAARRR
jgi:hypothetical protein